ncbi:hypothetical protein CVT24_002864 [Panaeolus cyanescens]|uniref:Uncharacterized protein n=1 Tax=Panaeolus cyanescens TaxID=181874 RepID=A0A409YRJ7_9AGAR|nr:hypothetical protein CVT24_002864 [Panaeolus cyanescens]
MTSQSNSQDIPVACDTPSQRAFRAALARLEGISPPSYHQHTENIPSDASPGSNVATSGDTTNSEEDGFSDGSTVSLYITPFSTPVPPGRILVPDTPQFTARLSASQALLIDTLQSISQTQQDNIATNQDMSAPQEIPTPAQNTSIATTQAVASKTLSTWYPHHPTISRMLPEPITGLTPKGVIPFLVTRPNRNRITAPGHGGIRIRRRRGLSPIYDSDGCQIIPATQARRELYRQNVARGLPSYRARAEAAASIPLPDSFEFIQGSSSRPMRTIVLTDSSDDDEQGKENQPLSKKAGKRRAGK